MPAGRCHPIRKSLEIRYLHKGHSGATSRGRECPVFFAGVCMPWSEKCHPIRKSLDVRVLQKKRQR